MIKELESLSALASEPLSYMLLAVNLAVGTLMSLVIRWHFQRYGTSLSNRQEFSEIFPFIVLTTLLVITVVKSSLALSLGLVGALSIVRFRTPIKEPEELAYLFLSIAVGPGAGRQPNTCYDYSRDWHPDHYVPDQEPEKRTNVQQRLSVDQP